MFDIVITGGGTEVIGNILRRGGASSFILEAQVPYNENAFDSYLDGLKLKKKCSQLGAYLLALSAYNRGEYLTNFKPGIKALSCTASLRRTEEERTGRENHAWICYVDTEKVQFLHRQWNNSHSSRLEEEIELAQILQEIIEDGYIKSVDATTIKRLNTNDYRYISRDNSWREFGEYGKPTIIFPGSFNPIHEGHAAIIRRIYNMFGVQPNLEISLSNADKDFITYEEYEKRAQFIQSVLPVYKIGYGEGPFISCSIYPTFHEKREQYSHDDVCPKYVMGSDTFVRMMDYEKYKVSEPENCTFIVSARGEEDSKLLHAYNPKENVMFIPNNFAEVSSTKIREGGV